MKAGVGTQMTKKTAKMSRFKFPLKTRFFHYCQKSFPEHAHFLKSSRKKARRVLILYPIVGLLLLSVPLLGVSLGLQWLFSTFPPWLAHLNFLTKEQGLDLAVGVKWAAAVFGLVGTFVAALVALSRADDLIFSAEAKEVELRQLYYLRELFKNQRKSATKNPANKDKFREPSVDFPRAVG
jgi:hypothetical protein